jgi:hypothetical protein
MVLSSTDTARASETSKMGGSELAPREEGRAYAGGAVRSLVAAASEAREARCGLAAEEEKAPAVCEATAAAMREVESRERRPDPVEDGGSLVRAWLRAG